jgi:hypothetical protein
MFALRNTISNVLKENEIRMKFLANKDCFLDEQAEKVVKISANLTDEPKAIAEFWAAWLGSITRLLRGKKLIVGILSKLLSNSQFFISVSSTKSIILVINRTKNRLN